MSEGPEAGFVRLVMLMVEPIPAADTMIESDWRIKRGKLGMRFVVKDIKPAEPTLANTFILNGHELQRAFTAETR